jgi:hypothetical protein
MEKTAAEKNLMHDFVVSADVIMQMLNEKLRVIVSTLDVKAGDVFRMKESLGRDFSGRIFYGKAIHAFPGFFQFELFGYADDADGERFSIAGDYPHEKKEFPTEPWEIAEFDFDGTRPAWLYEGIKWHSEVSIARLGFDASTKARPEDVILRVQGRGGERYFAYEAPTEVTEKFTTALKP